MRLNINGIQFFFVLIFLVVVTNIFLTGFNEADSNFSISGFFFYLLIVLVLCLHLLIGRVDFIFIIGCALTIGLKLLSFGQILSDTLMIAVLAWGISYVRYDFTKLHFNLIFTYGCLSIVVTALQVLGIEQFHTWNTLMTDIQGNVDAGLSRSIFSTPIWLVEQSQLRPPGLFHSNAVFSLFVCYFYALTLQKSLRLLPLGILAIWLCGSKIALLFSFVFPVVMIFTREDLPKLFFLKVLMFITGFIVALYALSPELSMRRYATESFLFSMFLRLNDLNQILNLGIDLNSLSVLEGVIDGKQREDATVSGILVAILFFVPLFILNFRRFGSTLKKHSAELTSALIVSLATPITGNAFFIFLIYPIFSSLRRGKA